MEKLLNIIFTLIGPIIWLITGVINAVKSAINFIITNKADTKKFLIFTGLIFYPIALVLCYLVVNTFKNTFHSGYGLTGHGHLVVWLFAILLCGVVGAVNVRDYFFYKKRCFGSLRQWHHEERYSAARRKQMYPPIRNELVSSEIKGLCLGKTGLGPLKKYICLDLYKKEIANHLVIIGNSSAGKSSGPILTSLIANFMNCDENTPPPVTYLVVDAKPELCRLSSSGGKWTRILNPKAKRGTSYGWNLYYDINFDSPMDVITDRINSVVDVIVHDDNPNNVFFQDSARNLLTGCLIYEFVVHHNNFIKSIHNILSTDLDEYVKKVKTDKKCPKNALMLLAEFGNENDKSNATEDIKKSLKQQTAVFTRSDTEWFLDTECNKLMCCPWDLDDSISMFLSIKRADLKTFGVLFRLIISQCSDHLSRRDEDDPSTKPVVILIDEFTNLGGTVPRFAEDLGFIRSKKVTYVTIFQQYSQLQKLYGKEEARTILNMGHQLILSCEDTELGKIFSDKGGEFKDTKTSYKRTGGILSTTVGEETVSETKEKRIRVMDDLTSLFPRFESIAFINGSEYIRFSKCRYYLEPELHKRSADCQRFHELTAADETN